MPAWLTPFLGFLQPILDRVLPDKTKQAELAQQLALAAQAQAGAQLQADLQLALGQTDINKIEAASGDKFASRWRPAVGWVCVLALCWQYLAWPLLAWASLNFSWQAPPRLDLGDVLALLPALLGLGAYRSFDKLKGTAL